MSPSVERGRLSVVDKKILKILLAPDGKKRTHVVASAASDAIIAAELRVPLSVVKKSRMSLEEDFLELIYSMKLASLGYRRVDFLISTGRGLAASIAEELMKINGIVRVGQSIGEPTIDLRAELIIKDNGELLELLEQVKAIDGVRNVVWSEIVKVVGDKGSVPAGIIDLL